MSRLRALALALAETVLQQRTVWRPAGLAVVWVVLMLAAAQALTPLKSLDWRLLDALDAGGKQWPSTVEIVDLQWSRDPGQTDILRRRIADVLLALAALEQPPRIVVIDVALSTLPIGLPGLKEAVTELDKVGVKIIAVAGPEDYPIGLDRIEAQRRRGADQTLYGTVAEFGHTDIAYSDGSTAWYRPCEPLPLGGCLASVPEVVAAGLFKRTAREDANAQAVVFVPGAAALREGHVWQLQDGRLTQAADIAADVKRLSDRIVIVGNMAYDRVGPWIGPEVLAWAIADAVTPYRDPRILILRDPLNAVASALAFGGVTLGLFMLLHRWDPRGHRIGLTAVASAICSVVALAVTVLTLRRGLQVAHYQVAYSLAGVVFAAMLAWSAATRAMLTRALYTNISGAKPGAPARWDVFVSYSHSPPGNIERVRKQIVEPLRRCRVGERPMEVFFDESGIRVGTSWYTELAEGIERSSCVVAVYTTDYFCKSFCLFEMRKAVVRDIADRGQTFHVLPILLDENVVPPLEFNHLQYGKDCDPGRVVQTVCQALRDLGLPIL